MTHPLSVPPVMSGLQPPIFWSFIHDMMIFVVNISQTPQSLNFLVRIKFFYFIFLYYKKIEVLPLI